MKSIARSFLIYWNNYRLKRKMPRMIPCFIGKDGKPIKNTSVSSSTFIDYPQNLTLGEGVYIGHHNFLEASNELIIEKGCQITTFVTITTHSSHQSIRLYGKSYAGAEMKGYIKGNIRIGKFTFIGPHSTIMPNTNIGKGSLIAAYSYVQGEFPDFSILAGNPAKVIGDTRTKDSALLEKYPELKPLYDAWAK